MKSNNSITTFLVFILLIIVNLSSESNNYKSPDNFQDLQNNFEKLLLKANKKHKGKTTKIVAKYKVKVKKNPLLKIKNKDKYDFYSQCVTKSGIINIVVKRPFPPIHVISTSPVFVIMTKREISVYKDLQQKKLIQKVNLEDIQHVDQYYINTFCFDIIVNKLDNKQILNTGPLSFCTENKESFDNWLNSILEFKQCSINIKRVNDTKVLVDFKRINFVKKKLGDAENFMSDLYYDGEDKFYKKTLMTNSTSHILDKAVDFLKKNMIRNKLEKRMIKRQYAGRMSNSRQFRHSFLNKHISIKKAMERKLAKQREIEFSALRKIHEPKELGIIMKVVNGLNEIKKSDLLEYKIRLEEKLRQQRERTKNEADQMLRIKIDEDKLLDYRVCYSERLKGFKDKKYIKKLCKHYYGETGFNICRKRASFCLMCCEFNIGLNFPKKRVICRLKCKKIINYKKKK